jgi:hypothetical protein
MAERKPDAPLVDVRYVQAYQRFLATSFDGWKKQALDAKTDLYQWIANQHAFSTLCRRHPCFVLGLDDCHSQLSLPARRPDPAFPHCLDALLTPVFRYCLPEIQEKLDTFSGYRTFNSTDEVWDAAKVLPPAWATAMYMLHKRGYAGCNIHQIFEELVGYPSFEASSRCGETERSWLT